METIAINNGYRIDFDGNNYYLIDSSELWEGETCFFITKSLLKAKNRLNKF